MIDSIWRRSLLGQSWLVISQLNRQKHLVIYLLSVLFTAFLDALSIFSVYPFISLITDLTVIDENGKFYFIYIFISEMLGLSSPKEFIFAFGLTSIFLILLSSFLRSYLNYKSNLLLESMRALISKLLLDKYLSGDFLTISQGHSSEHGKLILSEVDQFVDYILRSFANIISFGAILGSTLIILISVNPTVAFWSSGILISLYLLTYVVLRRWLLTLGGNREAANNSRFKLISESLAGFREIRVFNLQTQFVESFSKYAANYARSHALHQTAHHVPHYLIEALIFGVLILSGLLIVTDKSNEGQSFLIENSGILAFYALSLVRIKPAVQVVYQSFAALRFGAVSLQALVVALDSDRMICSSDRVHNEPKLSLKPMFESLKLQNVSFRTQASNFSMSELNLDISRGDRVGLVGRTGSGKTTLLNLIMGFYQADSGFIAVKSITGEHINPQQWNDIIAYVPQRVFLFDGTILENITIGEITDRVDMDHVNHCCKLACIFEDILSMKNGFNTSVGEGGDSLSGGQKQRIAIARALYKKPQFIIFDEATSALDKKTEHSLVKNVVGLNDEMTCLIVTHSTELLAHCHRTVELSNGKIVN